MRILPSIAFLVLLAVTSAYAQEGRRVWVLIVGISDYEFLNDLEYADDDALAFQKALANSLGELYKEEQVKILLNKDATSAGIEAAMRWLLKSAKENDRVFFYFSGHGGFEDLTDFKLGYLHSHNAFTQTYSNGGNISLEFLQAFLQTLSHRNITTIFVVDACHSGKADGSANEFMFLNSALANETQNISKILSAQGSEKSYENASWGGGHGVFTYYLIWGLMGFADTSPADGFVSMLEIERYLFDKVPQQTQFLQNPKVVSGRKDIFLATVNDAALAEYKKIYKDNESANLLEALSKGSNEYLIQDLPDSVKEIYAQFREAIKVLQLIEPDKKNAFFYFDVFRKQYPSHPLLAAMEEQLYVVSMDQTQRYINVVLNIGENTDHYSKEQLMDILSILNKLLEITPKDDALYPKILAKQRLIYGDVEHMKFDNSQINAKQFKATLPYLEEAIKLDTTAAYPYYTIAALYYHIKEYDRAIIYSRKAIALAPNWSTPYNNMGNVYLNQNKLPEALEAYKNSVKRKANFPSAYSNLAHAYYFSKTKDSQQRLCWLDSAIYYFGVANKAAVTKPYRAENFSEAADAYYIKYGISHLQEDLQKAIDLMTLAINEGTKNPELLRLLADFQLKLDKDSPDGYVTSARYFSSITRFSKALREFEEARMRGYTNWEEFESFPETVEFVKSSLYLGLKSANIDK